MYYCVFDAHKEVNTIKGIFDKIKIKHNNTLDFDIVTIINTINDMSDGFSLVYVLEKFNENGSNQGALLSKTQYALKENIDEEGLVGSFKNQGQMISSEHFENINFPGKGKYELQVYKYDKETDMYSKKFDEISLSMINKNQLECAYNFIVD